MTVDPERIAWVLLDALSLGDTTAARKWQVSRRTVERYRSRLREDRDLAALVQDKMVAHEAELGALRVRFLRKALAEMERRLVKDDTTLPDIAEAVRVVGELHQVSEALGENEGTEQDPEPAEDAGGSVGTPSLHAH